MKKIISLFLFISIACSLVACNITTNEPQYTTRAKEISRTHFNTISAIYTYADTDNTNIEKYAKICDDMLLYYHKLFDIYYEYSGVNNIKTINRNAGKNAIKVDRELVDFLLYCKQLYTLTNGKTNIMLGSVLNLWHEAREIAGADFGYLRPEDLPTEAELEEANTHTSIDLLVIDEEACTVYISDPEASIDVGAIAKGYAVDAIYQRLKDEGADSVVLNIGGNIRTFGLKPNGDEWVSGIRDPLGQAADSIKCRLSIGEASIVTSGDYERFFISGEKKYHHIIDPVTLVPAEYFASVSIISNESGLSDALSTALFCMSYEDGAKLVKGIDNVEVLWVFKDGTVKMTDGISIAD